MKRNIITIINLLLLVMSTGNMYALERGNRIYSNVQFETGNIEKTNEVVQTRSIDVKCEGNNYFNGQYCIVHVIYEARLNNNNVLSTRVLSSEIIYSSMPKGPNVMECGIVSRDNSLLLILELNWRGNGIAQNNQYIFSLPKI